MAGSVLRPAPASANPTPADQASSSPQTTPAAAPGNRFSRTNAASLPCSSDAAWAIGPAITDSPPYAAVMIAGDQQRVLVQSGTLACRWGADPHARHGEAEQQRVLGVPVDWYGSVNRDGLRWLTHPVHQYKRWVQHRRLGPYAPDNGDPE